MSKWVEWDDVHAAFDGADYGYIMIGKPRSRWIPVKLAHRFPDQLMVFKFKPVTVEETNNPDVGRMKERE